MSVATQPRTHEREDRDGALQKLSIGGILKKAAFQFMEDRAFILGAALAFYTSLSIGPLIVILLWVAGSGGPHVQERLIEQMGTLIGEGGGRIMRIIITNAREQPEMGTVAGLGSVVVLLFSATAAFAHLQTTLNMVWNVRPSPGREIRQWFWKRLLSLGMVVTGGFLLLISLLASTVIAFVINSSLVTLPGTRVLWTLSNAFVSVTIFTLLFATVFRFLPDVEIAWHDVWMGAVTTSCLLWAGKELIGLYLGQSGVGSAYGAAGSLVFFLVWVYYSALLVFFGAELTQVWARCHGRRIRPSAAAEWDVDVAH